MRVGLRAHLEPERAFASVGIPRWWRTIAVVAQMVSV